MVLCYSRQMYVEFTLGRDPGAFPGRSAERLRLFRRRAPEDDGGQPEERGAFASGGTAGDLQPRYLDFAAFHGFAIKACNVRAAHEKGRVENAVGYVKKNFLNGLDLTSLEAPSTTPARRWLDEVANVRLHAQTRQKPAELLQQEKPKLLPLRRGRL